MSEPAFAAFAGGEVLGARDRFPAHLLDLVQHELRDAFAAPDHEILGGEVEQDDSDFAAVVGVDRAGAVEHAQAVLERQPRARPHLALVSGGDGDLEPRRHQRPAAGLERQRRLRGDGGAQVQPRRVCGLILRQRQPRGVRHLVDEQGVLRFGHRVIPFCCVKIEPDPRILPGSRQHYNGFVRGIK